MPDPGLQHIVPGQASPPPRPWHRPAVWLLAWAVWTLGCLAWLARADALRALVCGTGSP